MSISADQTELVPIALPTDLSPAPTGWQWTKLTELARLESGHTPSRSRPDWWDGDVSWISLTEIRRLDGHWTEETRIKTNPAGIAHSAARILPKGTVCFSRTASVGFVTIMAKPMATSQDFANWVCGDELDPEFLMYALIRSRDYLRTLASGATHKTIYMPTLEQFRICAPPRAEQERIVAALNAQMAAAEGARVASETQVEEIQSLAYALIRHPLKSKSALQMFALGDVLEEVKSGIGSAWASYPVLGATRDGLAAAKEPVGKHPERYKPVVPGTLFYNPMRILIGSIAMVDDGDAPGITSPDYVVLRGKRGVVDTRWFYYWLRSPLGAACIASLARGAVRERMLFNRLAQGTIELPAFDMQCRISESLALIRPLQLQALARSRDIESLPRRLLRDVFSSQLSDMAREFASARTSTADGGSSTIYNP